MDNSSPDFDAIKQINPYGVEYWSARDLAPLLGYDKWQNFDLAIERAIIACQQVEQIVTDHFTGVSKMIELGKGGHRNVKDYLLSRLACYLIAQNGDPRKKEIASAQIYFAISTRENELHQLHENQEKRLLLRERVAIGNTKLAEAAQMAGVLSKNFGTFQNKGYQGLYGGLDTEGIRLHKGIGKHEDILDRMGRAELAANDFRITQTEEVLNQSGYIGEVKAITTHYEVGQEIRQTIERIGGRMPETLPPEPSIKPLLNKRRRSRKKLQAKAEKGENNSHVQEELL